MYFQYYTAYCVVVKYDATIYSVASRRNKRRIQYSNLRVNQLRIITEAQEPTIEFSTDLDFGGNDEMIFIHLCLLDITGSEAVNYSIQKEA